MFDFEKIWAVVENILKAIGDFFTKKLSGNEEKTVDYSVYNEAIKPTPGE